MTTLWPGLIGLLGGNASGSDASSDPATVVPAFRRAVAKGAEARGIAAERQEADFTRAMAGFRDAVARAKNAEAALRDPRVLNVLLPALGMPDATGQAGLAARALTADPRATDGLLARLGDGRWKRAAQTLDLYRRGIEALRDPAVQANLERGLAKYRWRTGQDEAAPGVSDALYLRDRAGSITDVYQILGDAALRRVVTGALGLPQEIAIQPVDAQARAIASRYDVSKLNDPKEAQRLAERYLILRGAQPSGSISGASRLSLFA